MTARRRNALLLAAIAAFLAAALGWPLALMAGGAFVSEQGGLTASNVAGVLADPSTRRALGNSFVLATLTTAIALALALPLAVLATRFRFPGRRALAGLLLVPLVLPPFVGAIGVRHVLGRMGALNAVLGTDVDWLGNGGLPLVAAVQALALLPVMYLNVAAALANVDPVLEDAARASGASAWTRLRRVTLPLVRPGVFAGATIVFVWAFTELGTPLMFELHDVTSVQVFDGIKEVEASRRPYALVTVMLACSVGIYLLGKALLGRMPPAAHAKASVRREERTLRGWRAIAAAVPFAAVGALAALPAAGVLLASVAVPGQWYGSALPRAFTDGHFLQALSHPLAAGSVRNSLLLATAAAALALVVGFLAARLLVRGGMRLGWALDAAVMLPLAVPGIVLAFGYVAVSLRWPFGGPDAPLGGLASVIGADPSPFPFLVVAYAVRRLPFVTRSAVAGLEQTSEELEDAARAAGASRARALRTVVVPLVAANLLAGALLAFSLSMLEVGDSLILAQREAHYPVTKAIWALAERLGDGPGIASAMGVWAMALLAATLLGAGALLGRRADAMFRA